MNRCRWLTDRQQAVKFLIAQCIHDLSDRINRVKRFWNQTKPLFSRLNVTFFPTVASGNVSFPQDWCQKPAKKHDPTKESSLLLGGVQHAHMLQWAREEVQNGWMSWCLEVDICVKQKERKSGWVRRVVLGSWFPVLGDEKENTFFFAYPNVGYAFKMVEGKHQLYYTTMVLLIKFNLY